MTVSIVEYIDKEGRSPLGRWFLTLEARAAAKVRVYIARLEQGDFSNVEGVGEGVFECKIDYGPGYRFYFGKDGETLVILLHGGHKKTQPGDIKAAKTIWREYKSRKKKESKQWH
jgi:putative addiction module killer protein